MRNSKGIKIDSYQEKFGTVVSSGPDINFNSNGTYEKLFTSINIDTGTWKLNKKSMIIEYNLLIDSTDWVGKDLISKDFAKKASDGNYYERIDDQVLFLDDQELILNQRNKQVVFNKVKE